MDLIVVVYKVKWQGREVAAKVLNQQYNEDQEAELAREVELMAQLDSPYLVSYSLHASANRKYKVEIAGRMDRDDAACGGYRVYGTRQPWPSVSFTRTGVPS